jgi:hypothetical protein
MLLVAPTEQARWALKETDSFEAVFIHEMSLSTSRIKTIREAVTAHWPARPAGQPDRFSLALEPIENARLKHLRWL